MKASATLAMTATMVAGLMSPADVRGCSICDCGDPLLAASDPAAITGKLRLQLDTEYLRIDAGTDGQPGYVDHLTQWSYRLNAVVRPMRRLSVMVTAPLLDKSIRTVGAGRDQVTSSLVGLGDAEVAARYAVWRQIDFAERRVQEVALSGGTMIPTGSNDARTTDAVGAAIPVDPHGQLGTGGWGPFAGLHYRFEQADWLGFADASYRVRTTGSYFDGSKYKFGNAVLWSLHAQYRPIALLAVDLGMDGRYAGADRATDAAGTVTDKVENTGGTVLSAAPGVYVSATSSVWLFVRGQIPFYKDLSGEQDVKPPVTVGLQYQAL
jgi:hypothetical protein